MSRVGQVQEIYAAFGSGDIDAILSQLADDIEWEYGGTAAVPWLVPRRGKGEVPKFFQALAAELELSRVQPKAFFEDGNTVLVLIDFDATAKSSGRTITEEDEVHIWQFNDNGRVARFRHRADTLQHWRAMQR